MTVVTHISFSCEFILHFINQINATIPYETYSVFCLCFRNCNI